MRMDLRPLLRGHVKAMTDSRHPKVPDTAARIVLWGIPPLAGIVGALLHAQIRQPGSLLAAVALLAGVLIGSFAFISTMRTQMTQRRDPAHALCALWTRQPLTYSSRSWRP